MAVRDEQEKVKQGRRRSGQSKYAYHFHFHGDWLRGVAKLTPEERGVYDTIINLTYAERRALPDDDEWLARQCNCPLKTYRRIKRQLLEKGRVEVDEEAQTILDRRALEELAAAGVMRERLAEQGRNGAEKRWGTRPKKPKAIHTENAKVVKFSPTSAGFSQQEVTTTSPKKQEVSVQSAMEKCIATQNQNRESPEKESPGPAEEPRAALPPKGGGARVAPEPAQEARPVEIDPDKLNAEAERLRIAKQRRAERKRAASGSP